MTTTAFTWKTAQLERETSDGCMFTVHYTFDAKDDTYSAGIYGSIGLERLEGDMVPFADLAEEMVVGWVEEKFGDKKVAEIEDALQAQIEEQHQSNKAASVPW